MKYLLDTSVCVGALQSLEPVTRRLAQIGTDAIALSAMTVTELRFGVLKGRAPRMVGMQLDRFLAIPEILASDADAAQHHATTRWTLARAGTQIGERNLVIAATALTHRLMVAKGNVREFRRVPGLEVEEWTQ